MLIIINPACGEATERQPTPSSSQANNYAFQDFLVLEL